MKCRHTSKRSPSSFSLRRSAANIISLLLLLSITSLFPPPTNCQLLGSLMSMTGLGNLNPFSGLSSGLSGGGLLSSLRGGGGGSSSLFGSLTGSSSSMHPGAGGSMMSSFTPDLGTNIITLHIHIFISRYTHTFPHILRKSLLSNLLIRKNYFPSNPTSLAAFLQQSSFSLSLSRHQHTDTFPTFLSVFCHYFVDGLTRPFLTPLGTTGFFLFFHPT